MHHFGSLLVLDLHLQQRIINVHAPHKPGCEIQLLWADAAIPEEGPAQTKPESNQAIVGSASLHTHGASP